MKVPWQNSPLIQCVRQKNCPTPKSQCNADNAYSKARGYGRCGVCIENREGATREREHRWALAVLSSISFMGHGYWYPHSAANSTKLVCVMITLMREKHTGRTVNGWLGYKTIFFPGFGWKGEWHSSVSYDWFLLLPLQHCKLQNHTLRQHNEKSSSELFPWHFKFSPFSRFVQIKHYIVSKLLRVLQTSRLTEIILNMVSVHADENSEMQTQPLVWGLPPLREAVLLLSDEACQHFLYSAALNLFLANGAEKSPFPGNHLRHLPLYFKPLKNPEAYTRRIQNFFWSHIIFSLAPNYRSMYTDQLPVQKCLAALQDTPGLQILISQDKTNTGWFFKLQERKYIGVTSSTYSCRILQWVAGCFFGNLCQMCQWSTSWHTPSYLGLPSPLLAAKIGFWNTHNQSAHKPPTPIVLWFSFHTCAGQQQGINLHAFSW